ncbi:translesion DNA synthesis-associated protein ImuA [Luteimonas marina]|uniref:Translesion DNA synthesis-associated protein ImuA n=1 Tax=Luteimonas marina TaxID=488485 RepID=A0A5C5U6B1_9GAMM|nr:translesion DNA synthesis-associated protein ImuA [Luteimonas marina]
MAATVALEQLLAARTLWHAGRRAAIAPDGESTGFEALDALLPQRGWPRRALTELLLPVDGVGELSLLLPTLARLTRAGGTVAVVAPPCVPYAPAWQDAGVELSQLQVIDASPRDALWAFEQCLRSGACAAVLGWPVKADAQALRRLQVAADSGECLGFALRDRKHAANPSPAALRLEAVGDAAQGIVWRVRKCRGGSVPMRGFVARVSEAASDGGGPEWSRPMAERFLPLLAGGEEGRLRAIGPRPDERPKAVPEGRAGWDGGALRAEATLLRLPPTPTLPRKRGRERNPALLLPPPAGEGRDGGALRAEATPLHPILPLDTPAGRA